MFKDVMASQKELVDKIFNLDRDVRNMRKKATKLAEEYLSPLGITYHTHSINGYMSREWDPHIEVTCFESNGYKCIILEDTWVYVDSVPTHKVYPRDIKNIGTPDPEAVIKRCCNLSEYLGLPVRIKVYEKAKVADSPRSLDDLFLIHPEAVSVNEGKIWSVGWDCPDYYFVLRIGDTHHLYWSSDGHDCALINHAILQNPSRFVGDFEERIWRQIAPVSD